MQGLIAHLAVKTKVQVSRVFSGPTLIGARTPLVYNSPPPSYPLLKRSLFPPWPRQSMTQDKHKLSINCLEVWWGERDLLCSIAEGQPDHLPQVSLELQGKLSRAETVG